MPVRHRIWCAWGLLGLALLTGCAVGPRYARPAAPTPADFKETPPNWKEAQPSDQILRGKWWEIYQDPQLNTLEEKIAVSNQTLKASEAQFLQARALVRYNRADLFPTISTGVSATRERFSRNRPLSQQSGGGTFNDQTSGARCGGMSKPFAPVRKPALRISRW
jgi:outer membrane protein TolC